MNSAGAPRRAMKCALWLLACVAVTTLVVEDVAGHGEQRELARRMICRGLQARRLRRWLTRLLDLVLRLLQVCADEAVTVLPLRLPCLRFRVVRCRRLRILILIHFKLTLTFTS